MKLFQSIFGGAEKVGSYPESLIDMATERAVDGTDSRLRLVPGYRKRLRKPVIEAIDHEGVLRAYLEIVAEVLGAASSQIWADEITLYLDPMNIQRNARDPSARRIVLQELRNVQGRCVAMLPISITQAELPPRPDFVAEAQRYLNASSRGR